MLKPKLRAFGNAANSIGPLYIWRNVVARSQSRPDDGGMYFLKMGFADGEKWMTGPMYIFHNTLFDENAASHIALGQAYSSCVKDGDKLSKDGLAARGANDSLIHVDWMIGSDKLDIDGVSATGTVEPLMRGGEWAA